MEWQPIETAPKDGTRILAWSPRFERWTIVSWSTPEPFGGDKEWCGDSAGPGYNNSYDDLTHWQPLPDPPKPEGQ